jgi:acetoin utilization deacetylase AcuC-like enzyme
MIVITTDHAAHDPNRFTLPGDTRPYWEVPARADALLGAVRGRGLTTKPAGDHGLAPIERIHDAGYLAFLRTAFARWQAAPGSGPILRAPAYAVRHKARLPDAVAGQAGWYLSSITAPIVAATWVAAEGSAHAAIDAGDSVISGERYAYALCRPPGHHARRWVLLPEQRGNRGATPARQRHRSDRDLRFRRSSRQRHATNIL